MYWAFKLSIHRFTCPSKVHSLEEPSPWLSSAISWPLTRYNSYSLFGGLNFVSLKNIIYIFFTCISHHTSLAYPFCAQISYFILCVFFQYPLENFPKKKKKKDNLISLKYLILIINCGAYWNLNFIWATLNIVNTVTTWLQFIPFDSLT